MENKNVTPVAQGAIIVPKKPQAANTSLATTDNTKAITYKSMSGEEITLSPQMVRNLTNNNQYITESEISLFIDLCRYQKLNPFLREAYLIKFDGSKPAQQVVGLGAFQLRARKQRDCLGWDSGVIVITESGEEKRREGSFYLPNEKLVGAWATLYRGGDKRPTTTTVSFREYDKQQAEWKTKPGYMIEKVAVVNVIRKTYPEDFNGIYVEEEMPLQGKFSPTSHDDTVFDINVDEDGVVASDGNTTAETDKE